MVQKVQRNAVLTVVSDDDGFDYEFLLLDVDITLTHGDAKAGKRKPQLVRQLPEYVTKQDAVCECYFQSVAMYG